MSPKYLQSFLGLVSLLPGVKAAFLVGKSESQAKGEWKSATSCHNHCTPGPKDTIPSFFVLLLQVQLIFCVRFPLSQIT